MAFLEKTELQVNSFLKVSYIYHVLLKNLSGNFKQHFKRYNICFYRNWFLKLILKFVSRIDVWVLFARGHFSCLNRPQFFSRVAIWGSKNIGAISSQSINIASQYALRRNSILLHSSLNPAQHFWLSTKFSCCLKMKSVENILGYIREQFYRFSRGCKPRENL